MKSDVVPPRSDRSDAGFTLPEVIMYALLLGIVLAVAAGIMMSGTIAEKTVRTVFGASTSSQLAADSIETGIRNSSGFQVTAPTASTQLVLARVAQGGSAILWACGAWYYSPTIDDGSLWYKSSPTAITVPTTTDLKTWTRLANNVKPTSGTTIFTISGDQLNFSFKTLAGNDPPAGTTSSSASRSEVWETAPCF